MRYLKYGLYILSNITLLLSSSIGYADDSYYCTQNHAYIHVGMTESQVIAACGQPKVRQDATVQISRRVPITQLIYNNLNQGALFNGWTTNYNMWSLPSGSTGISLQVEITNNKVSAISVNGSSSNASDLCQGSVFQIGDDVNAVYNACGQPNAVNNSFINQPIPSTQKPQNWIYHADPYQPKFSLTFTDGVLQAIDTPDNNNYD